MHSNMIILKRLFRGVKFPSSFFNYCHYCVSNVVKLSPENCYKLLPETLVENSLYYFEDGFRKVYPHFNYFSGFVKKRWIDKKIIDFYSAEFPMYIEEVWKKRIQMGFVKVNNKVVDENYVLKNKDLLSAKLHRHELPVLDCPVNILFEDDKYLVVDKPPSIPVHPCGLYFNNSVVNILANDYNKSNLFIVYRIDRLSSGVLIFAKSANQTTYLQSHISNRNVDKEYICRVKGNFPDGTVVCGKPIKDFHRAIGLHLVHSQGKTAFTTFKKISYNGKSSVVLCKPHTGRTHQIRVHLHYLGYPIINDPLYNSSIFESIKIKKGMIEKPISELLDELLGENGSEWEFRKLHTDRSIPKEKKYLNYTIFKEFYRNQKLQESNKDSSLFTSDEDCLFCNEHIPEQPTLGMFLHARKYSCGNWSFEAPLPFWASESWNEA